MYCTLVYEKLYSVLHNIHCTWSTYVLTSVPIFTMHRYAASEGTDQGGCDWPSFQRHKGHARQLCGRLIGNTSTQCSTYSTIGCQHVISHMHNSLHILPSVIKFDKTTGNLKPPRFLRYREEHATLDQDPT